MPAPTPFPSFLAFSWTSVLASSISSRTSSEAFSETSLTMSPIDLSAESGGREPLPGVMDGSLSLVAAPESLDDLGQHQPADERPANEQLGTLGERVLAGSVGLGGRLAPLGRRAGAALSGRGRRWHRAWRRRGRGLWLKRRDRLRRRVRRRSLGRSLGLRRR